MRAGSGSVLDFAFTSFECRREPNSSTVWSCQILIRTQRVAISSSSVSSSGLAVGRHQRPRGRSHSGTWSGVELGNVIENAVRRWQVCDVPGSHFYEAPWRGRRSCGSFSRRRSRGGFVNVSLVSRSNSSGKRVLLCKRPFARSRSTSACTCELRVYT